MPPPMPSTNQAKKKRKKPKTAYNRNYARAHSSKVYTINHRVALYQLRDIIEVHKINDILGDPPYCRKRFFLERNAPLKPLADNILDSFLTATIAELFAAKAELKLQRMSGMMFHAKMPYFGMAPQGRTGSFFPGLWHRKSLEPRDYRGSVRAAA
jgi:hypothetical protein